MTVIKNGHTKPAIDEMDRTPLVDVNGDLEEPVARTHTQIKTRIAELTAQRDAFIAQVNLEANQQIAMFNGRIAELELLLEPLEEQPQTEA